MGTRYGARARWILRWLVKKVAPRFVDRWNFFHQRAFLNLRNAVKPDNDDAAPWGFRDRFATVVTRWRELLRSLFLPRVREEENPRCFGLVAVAFSTQRRKLFFATRCSTWPCCETRKTRPFIINLPATKADVSPSAPSPFFSSFPSCFLFPFLFFCPRSLPLSLSFSSRPVSSRSLFPSPLPSLLHLARFPSACSFCFPIRAN